MSRTVARPVSGSGCGRWTTIRSAPFFKSTRDPDRSETSTPFAPSIAMTSAHRMPEGVGFVNILWSVRLCFVFMISNIILLWYQIKYHSPSVGSRPGPEGEAGAREAYVSRGGNACSFADSIVGPEIRAS